MSLTATRIDRQPAFVLHRRAYRESSFLLDLFTRDHGRVAAVARGMRAPRRGAATAQPLQPLLVAWSGRTELKTLGTAEAAAGAFVLAGERLYSALYVNELLLRLLPPQDPHPVLFEAYVALLAELAGGEALEPPLRRFELRLLRELGYGIALDHDTGTGGVLEPAAAYAFDPAGGFRRADAAALAQAYPGHVLAAIAREDFSDPLTRRHAKRLLRAALAELLGPRPLRSRSYFAARSPADGGQ